MKTYSMLAALLVLACHSTAQAGGPPPVYVVVDKVILNPGKSTSLWVQIWGSFTRVEKRIDKAGNVTHLFTKPVYGYVYLSLPNISDQKLTEEIHEWKMAAGTGKAVAVGSCGDAGSLLTCRIYQQNETVTQPDAEYTKGFLKLFGNMYASKDLADQPYVKALLKFAGERK